MINHDALDASADGLTDEQLRHFSRKRLLQLAKQERAPAVAKAAAAELWERVEPKKERAEAQMTAAEAGRIANIYDDIFGETNCPNCGHAWIKGNESGGNRQE